MTLYHDTVSLKGQGHWKGMTYWGSSHSWSFGKPDPQDARSHDRRTDLASCLAQTLLPHPQASSIKSRSPLQLVQPQDPEQHHVMILPGTGVY